MRRRVSLQVPRTPTGAPAHVRVGPGGLGLSLLVPNVQPITANGSSTSSPIVEPTAPTPVSTATSTTSSTTTQPTTTTTTTPTTSSTTPTTTSSSTSQPPPGVVIPPGYRWNPNGWIENPGKPNEYWDPKLFMPGGALASTVPTNTNTGGATKTYTGTGETPAGVTGTGNVGGSTTTTTTVSGGVSSPWWGSDSTSSDTATGAPSKKLLWLGLGVIVLLALGGSKR